MHKICFFNTYPAWGGGVKFYIDHAIGMKEMGYDVCAVTSVNSELSKAYTKAQIPYIEINVTGRSLLNPFKVSRLIQYYKSQKIDSVLFTTSEDLKFGSVAAKIAGVKNIAYRRGLAVPIKNRWTNRYIFGNILTHIMANSEETKKTILQHLDQTIEADTIKVIYNALDTSTPVNETPLSTIKEKGTGLIIGNAGRLVTQKGQKYLIDIARVLKGKGIAFTIFIAGSGPLEEELNARILKEGLEKEIILLGYVAEMKNFMASIDVFALTSIWEGFGYVIVEAMLAQKPVVAFDTSSTPEIVLDSETGFLVSYPDTTTFADKISQLSEHHRRSTMGKNGRKSAQERFDIKKQILKFVDFIKH